MAKLKGPLFSLGASQQLGKALVYFSWKGLNVVREYVIPSNPKTAAQQKQRGYLTTMVTAIHAAQASTAHPFGETDVMGYALWASVVKAATTWFNQAVKNGIDQLVKGLREAVYTQATVIPGATQLAVSVWNLGIAPTGGSFWYGTSKTALINSKGGSFASGQASATITGLVKGTKYFVQFVPTAPATLIGTKSGIYYGVPT